MIVATPYGPANDGFDTSSVEEVVRTASGLTPEATIAVRSTIPVDFIARMRAETGLGDRLLFSPEFLRKGRTLHDNLHPSRFVVGECGPCGAAFAQLLADAAADRDVPVLLTGPCGRSWMRTPPART